MNSFLFTFYLFISVISFHVHCVFQDYPSSSEILRVEKGGFNTPIYLSTFRSDEAGGPDSDEVNATLNETYTGLVSRDSIQLYVYESVKLFPYESIRIDMHTPDHYDTSLPIFTVIRTADSILSLQVPVTIGDKVYNRISRTLCSDPKSAEKDLDTFLIDISTLSKSPINFTFSTSVVNSGPLHAERSMNIKVTPSQPQFLSYKLENDQKELLVKFQSDSSYCSIVSIQDAECPVYDQADDVTYQGYHQYFTKKAGIVIDRKKLKSDWFFIVVIVLASNDSCITTDLLAQYNDYNAVRRQQKPPNSAYLVLTAVGETLKTAFSPVLGKETPHNEYLITSKSVDVSVENVFEDHSYLWAILATFAAFSVFYIVFFVYAVVIYKKNKKLETEIVIVEEIRSKSFAATDNSSYATCTSNTAGSSQRLLHANERTNGSRQRRDSSSENEATKRGSNEDVDNGDALLIRPGDNGAVHERVITSKRPAICLAELATKKPKKLQRKYEMYVWTLTTVAIFYTLPVFLLMITYQFYFNVGNQDFCFYNFWCSRPYWFFACFNNIFSNIGYVLLGFLYFLVVKTKQVNYNLRVKLDPNLFNRGIPKHFGLFYAISVALMMEGVMSACYHVCPNWFNFQFDVSFMYIIAGLGLLRMYQTRHPDVNANSHAVFLWFAFIIAISVLGVVFHSETWFWYLFVVFYLLTIFYVTCQVYFITNVKIGLNVFCRIYNFYRREYFVRRDNFKDYMPEKLERFCLLTVANIINWCFGIYGLIYRPNDFGSYMVAIFITNLIIYFSFYILMKLSCKEKVRYTSVFLGFINVFTWIGALYFFQNASNNWQLSAAESRELNRDCVLLDFYDDHDIWHFLSAISLFISFVVILILDDDLDTQERTFIKVF